MACHILVVDDDQVIQTLVSATLESEGHRISVASTYAEAVTIFATRGVQLVLLDLVIPGDGVAFAARVMGQRVPIVVMSGVDGGNQIAERIGADDYLPKPFELTELLAVVERHCPPPSP